MRTESKEYSALEHVPTCSTWPPPWLISSTPPAIVDKARAEPSPALSLLDLPPELFEMWQERACIMHYDGRVAWKEAEALALIDVLRPVMGEAETLQIYRR